MERAVNEILRHQNEDGGWSIYPGGPSNIIAGRESVSCLEADGLAAGASGAGEGTRVDSRQRRRDRVSTPSPRFICASLGQYEYDAVPAVPPELILFPKWCYFNIYEISSWSRAIVVPLSIAYAKKPFKKLSPEQGIDELFVGGRENAHLHLRWDKKKIFGWRNIFLAADRVAHWAERVHIRPLRKVALKKAEKWMLERFEKSDGLGAIYPAMLNALIALALPGVYAG